MTTTVINEQTGQPWTDHELAALAEELRYHLGLAAREFLGKTARLWLDPDNTELADKDSDLAWRCIYEVLRHEADRDLAEDEARALMELNRTH
jgi:hypothetical protein